MRRSSTALAVSLVFSSCALSHEVGGTSAALLAPIELSQACQDEIGDSADKMPMHLECTGLYADMGSLKLADKVEPFQPVYPLWTDAADKHRWIYLPEGEKIDASDPSAWVFPAGTRFWKEFRNPAGTHKVETRVFVKMGDADWSYATYVWDDAQKRATREDVAKEFMVDGQKYGLPSHEQCLECHVGRRERVMGFDAVTLGMMGEHEGLTLDDLLKDKRLKNFDGDTHYQIGPNPDSAEAKALGWMHNNCGVSCHNSNPNSKAYSTKMRLILDPNKLDGRPTDDFDAVATTIDKDVFALQWQGQKRIVPGAPDQSLLYKLITSRGNPKQQMPPLGTFITDNTYVPVVKEWIEGMKAK
jgi:hypothetical protein